MLLSFVMLTGCMGIKTNSSKDLEHTTIVHNLTLEVENLNNELLDIQKEKDVEISRLKYAQENLIRELRNEIRSKNADVKMNEKGLVITFLAQIFFDSGKSDVKPEGLKVLTKISKTLKNLKREIRVEGHTDNVPIKHSRHLYKTNWELSAARAMSVLHFLQDQGLSPSLLSAAGYGEHQPVVPNASKGGQAKNRRVEIVILPKKIKMVGLNQLTMNTTSSKPVQTK